MSGCFALNSLFAVPLKLQGAPRKGERPLLLRAARRPQGAPFRTMGSYREKPSPRLMFSTVSSSSW